MLRDPDCGVGVGVGGGIGGGCFDCDEEIYQGNFPFSFDLELNTYFRFRRPGKYACRVTSAQVTSAAREEKFRPALLLKSNWVEFTLTSDPAWTHSAATMYADMYAKRCRGNEPIEFVPTDCFNVARRLSDLDTVESLAREIQFFDGKYHRWDNGFWDAITATSHPNEALKMMTSRMQDPDVQVSDSVVYSLAEWAMEAENPDAFASSATPSNYHSQAVEQLRKYVMLLGASLANKDLNVLSESVKTYLRLAEQPCPGHEVISEAERTAVLAAVEVRVRSH